MAHSYHELYGQEFTVLRYGIPYGPRMRPALVIPKFVTMALEGRPITINGDGSQHRNYLYVEDLAHAHVLALGDAGANQVFDLEGSERVTMRHLVDAISTALGRELDVTYGESRAGDYAGRPISARKADELLGWHPTVSFADGLLRYVDWHHQNVAAPVAVAGTEVTPVETISPRVGAARPPSAPAPPELMPVGVGAMADIEAPAVPELVPSRSIAAITGASAAVLLAPTLSLAGRPTLAVAALVAALAAAVLSRQLPQVPRVVAAGATLVGIGLLGVTTQTLVVLAAAALIGIAIFPSRHRGPAGGSGPPAPPSDRPPSSRSTVSNPARCCGRQPCWGSPRVAPLSPPPAGRSGASRGGRAPSPSSLPSRSWRGPAPPPPGPRGSARS